jgi:hypothetical protein
MDSPVVSLPSLLRSWATKHNCSHYETLRLVSLPIPCCIQPSPLVSRLRLKVKRGGHAATPSSSHSLFWSDKEKRLQ